jgi:hypothetical protein
MRTAMTSAPASSSPPATPPSNRHNGPALDAYEYALTRQEARSRGRWAAFESCRRFAIFAILLRQAIICPSTTTPKLVVFVARFHSL